MRTLLWRFFDLLPVGQTDRFKAAVAENPITELVSHYGTADMGPYGSLSELGGKPHEIPDLYRRSSPITYAHRCATPTLLIQGEPITVARPVNRSSSTPTSKPTAASPR